MEEDGPDAVVLVRRATRHYQDRGFNVDSHPAFAEGLRADLVVRKGHLTRALRVSEDPFGSYEIGAFAARCKRLKILPTIICPGTSEVVEACDQFGVEHLSPLGLAEAPPISAPRPVPAPPPRVVAVLRAPVATETKETTPIPAWRWAIVAAVWVLALLAMGILAERVFG